MSSLSAFPSQSSFGWKAELMTVGVLRQWTDPAYPKLSGRPSVQPWFGWWHEAQLMAELAESLGSKIGAVLAQLSLR